MPQIIGSYDREDGQNIADQKPVTGTTFGTKRLLDVAVLKRYGTNHYEKDGSTEYIGKEDSGGVWLVLKIVTTGENLALTYATIENNASVTTYSDAWTNRATLTYDLFSEAY